MNIRTVRREQSSKQFSISARYCPKCGAKNDFNAKFCRVCMTKLDIEIIGSDTKVRKCCDECGKEYNYKTMKTYWDGKVNSTLCAKCYRRKMRKKN